MPSLHSKWEARIKIPTGGWGITFTDSGGAGALTLTAANTYYHSSAGNDSVTLHARIAALANASGTLNGTYSSSIGAGENGTGTITFSCTESFSITFTNTDLRDTLGFTGNTGSATSHESDQHVQGLWLPDCPVETPYHLSSAGRVRSAGIVTLAEDGTYYAFHGASHTMNEYVYAACTQAKTITAAESTTGESYETFWKDAVRGEEPWAVAGRQLRFYKDTTDDATFLTYNVTDIAEPNYNRVRPDWDGLWSVRLDVVQN